VTRQTDAASAVPIRVLCVNLSSVVVDFLTLLFSRERDIVIVGSIMGYIEALLAVREGVDILILGAPRAIPMPGVCSLLLTEFPRLRIIVIATTQEEAAAYYLALTCQRLPSFNSEMLTNYIRTLYHHDITREANC
jgi:hypothetical protein